MFRLKIVIAIDSLKESLASTEAGEAAKAGIIRVYPKAEVFVRPLADGGEGTATALTLGLNGSFEKVIVTNPMGKKIEAMYGILPDNTAVIEMATAAGLTLISKEERNPFYATTYGVGELIRHAILKGCRRFIVGIGGSATNDGGAGMLAALGVKFIQSDGNEISLGAIGLKELSEIRTDDMLEELAKCEFRVACDVTNPLCGDNGASRIYSPQKGADPKSIPLMDGWLKHYATLAKKIFPKADLNYPGVGAAGGLGFAFQGFLNGALESGVKIVLEETKLEDYIKDADLVITGEGRLDAQTAMGKAPIGVAKIAKKYDKPVIAFAGAVTRDARELNVKGIDAFFPIARGVSTLEDALNKNNARQNMTDAVEQAMRLINIYRGVKF